MKKPRLLLSLLFLATNAIAQLHAPVYVSQFTQGTGWSMYYTDILVGHINNDTLPDVIFTMAEGYQVGYGKRDGDRISFDMQPVDFYRHGWWYFSGQLVDYDRDGDQDFITVVSDNFDFDLSYIMENEGGYLLDTFRPASPDFPNKARLFFEDFNQDTVLDLLYQITQPYSLHLIDGTTGQEVSLPFMANGTGVHDFNHDGRMDLYRVGFSSALQANTEQIYLNTGNYSFDLYETPGIMSYPPGFIQDQWGDFDGDGFDDHFSKPTNSTGLAYVFKSNMQSQGEVSFDTLLLTTTQYENARLVTDVTRDGTDDVIVFATDSLYFIETDPGMQFNVTRQAHIIHAERIQQHPELPPGIFLGMTSDGIPCLLTISYSDATGLSVHEDFNAFSPYVLAEAVYASPTASVDLDGDGQRELCVASDFTVAFAEMQDDQAIAETHIQQGYVNNKARALSSGDWNGDGHDDLFFTEGEKIYLSLRTPEGSLSLREFLTDGLLFDVHDFDRNGFDDLFIGMTDSIFILFNDQGAFVGQEILSNTRSFPEFNVFDPNQDGYPDVALSKDSTIVYMNQGDGTFVESPFSIPGNLARNTLPNSPYLFTVLFQENNGTIFYRPNLYRVATDGQDAHWVTGYVFIDSVINARESWLVNYDGDSIPDMLFNTQEVGSIGWKALMVNQQEALYALLTVPGSFILGAEDVAGDGAAEVLYVKGSKAYLEIGIPQDITSIKPLIHDPMQVLMYPNPVSPHSPWRLTYENEFYGPVTIDVFLPDGRHWQHHVVEKSTPRFESALDDLPLTSGMLLIRVEDGLGVVVKKVVVMAD